MGEDEEKVNTVSKRERGIEVKNMDEEINKVQSIYSPKLKKRKASEGSGTETDKQADKTDLGCKTDTLSSVKEQSSVEIGSKSLNEKDMKKEIENKKDSQIERPKETIEKENIKEESKVGKSIVSQEKNLVDFGKDQVTTGPTTDET